MTYHLDKTDKQIIELLQKNGRMPYLTIANKLSLSEGTVRRRVNRLIRDDILQIVGLTDPFKVGMNTVAIVGLKVERHRIEDISEALTDMPEVRYVALATGNYDLIIEIVVKNNEDLLTFLISKLSDIPGIIHTGTSLVLKVAKQNFTWEMPS